jgi:hypothetical protein
VQVRWTGGYMSLLAYDAAGSNSWSTRVNYADNAGSSQFATWCLTGWELITQINLSANGWVNFTGIPNQYYRHLMIVGWARSTRNSGHPSDSLALRFNSSSSSYYNIYLNARADNNVGSGNQWNTSYMAISLIEGDLSAGNHYSAVMIMIPNYRIGYAKRAHAMPGYTIGDVQAVNSYLQNRAGMWGSTAVISSIQLFTEQGVSNNLKAGSSFSLYGSRE